MLREIITTRAHGIDISPWQETYVYRDTWGQVDFAIQKMSEGLWWDQNYGRLWDVGVAEVPIRGMYHYQRSGVSWEAQANIILEMVERVTPRIHIISLDIEKGNNTLDKTFFADSGRILDYLSANSSRKIVQYINPDVYALMHASVKKNYAPENLQRWLYGYPMWLAQYWIFGRSPDKQPGTPKLRGDWDIYQYTDKGDSIVNGKRHYGSPDLDVFNGTLAEMIVWAGIGDSGPIDPLPTPLDESLIYRAGDTVVEFERRK